MTGQVILFCGLPATLKTYLSVRLSGRLGYVYMPTKAVGSLSDINHDDDLYKRRLKRYIKLSKLVKSVLSFGTNLIIDGGFPTSESKNVILNNTTPKKTVIIHCICDNTTRIKRIKKRAKDTLDHEKSNSKTILKNLKDNNQAFDEDDPEIELKNGKIQSILQVDTSNMSIKWKGKPPKKFGNKISKIIHQILEEFEQIESNYPKNEIIAHFNDLSEDYDTTTEWRKDDQILRSLYTQSIPPKSRVLDIGTGTGLASEWYAQKGHFVTGIDISPKMLRKASNRLNLVLLSSGTNLPFISNYFNLIIIRQCLHYINPKQLLDEAYRVLESGGQIALSGVICPNTHLKTFWTEFKNATQPLRQDVFTAEDFKNLLKNSGFNIKKEEYYSLTRREKIESIEKRARDIPNGLPSFLKNMEKLATNLFPELELKIQKNELQYLQSWVTIWAKK